MELFANGAANFTVMPVGCLGAAIQAGVVSGIFGGGAAQVTANVLDEQPLYYGLDRAAVPCHPPQPHLICILRRSIV